MNKIYKVIWSAVLHTWVVVSELVSLHKKSATVGFGPSQAQGTVLRECDNSINNKKILTLSPLALLLSGVLLLVGPCSVSAVDMTAGGNGGGRIAV
ncbi:ESPR domain-containing protein [Serratia sp. DD3]|uniref:ESPR domain-containing protein n=1 Tax=Serratia sp. DD3 TaxID=1410619 RepID=UPI0003C50BCA|nr:ESPR domain-containing protein [Serratia sp. DD3]KEY57898.1 type V secretory pathway, adhesin AidA [Serratia sp. DD3]